MEIGRKKEPPQSVAQASAIMQGAIIANEVVKPSISILIPSIVHLQGKLNHSWCFLNTVPSKIHEIATHCRLWCFFFSIPSFHFCLFPLLLPSEEGFRGLEYCTEAIHRLASLTLWYDPKVTFAMMCFYCFCTYVYALCCFLPYVFSDYHQSSLTSHTIKNCLPLY